MRKLRVGVIYGGRSGEHEVSLASAAAVIANLDRKRYEPVPIRIERDGRWTIPDRPPTSVVAADVIAKARQEAGAREPLGARGVPGAASRRGDAAHRRTVAGRDAVSRERVRLGAGSRRDLPGAARALRRGRHGAGPAGTGQRALRRGGRPGVGGRDGQGDDEGRLRRGAACPRSLTSSCCGATGTRRRARSPTRWRRAWDSRCSSSRPTSDRASASRRSARRDDLGAAMALAAGVRPQDRRRGRGAGGARDRMLGHRQRPARGVGAGRDRPVARVLRLRGQVHRGVRGADPGAARRRRRPTKCAGSRWRRSSRWMPRDSPGSTSCSRARRGASTSTRSTPFPGSPPSACSRSCGRRRDSATRPSSIAWWTLAFERHAGKQSLRTSYP